MTTANTPHYLRWSVSAIECYKRGCVCKGCYYDEFFKSSGYKCKMKQAVIDLVTRIGKPQDIIEQTIEE